MTNIPFYAAHGRRCGQTALKSILKAKLPERDFSHKELDELTFHSSDEMTFPCQIAAAFAQLGIEFFYPVSPGGFKRMNDNFEEDVFRLCGDHGERYLKYSSLGGIRKSVKLIRRSPGVVESETKPEVKDLERFLQEGRIPLCLINHDLFVGKENRFVGHYIILTGIDSAEITYHDNGPKNPAPNKRSPINCLTRAWNLSIYDHNLIVV